MHLVFERPSGEFKTNCNILALTWMPYYNEATFRSALFDYHQRQLFEVVGDESGSSDASNPGPAAAEAQRRQPYGHLAAAAAAGNFNLGTHSQQHQQQPDPSGRRKMHEQMAQMKFSNSRMAELYQRYLCTKNYGLPTKLKGSTTNKCQKTTSLAESYGLVSDLGWLVVGNVGKIVGITLTSTIEAPSLSSEERERSQVGKTENRPHKSKEDLMHFDSDDDDYYLVNYNRIAPTTSDSAKSSTQADAAIKRDNYNLRGHLDEVILVKWNELYQKLATIDSKGNVLIWCKVNEKFTIQTPFYNRTKSVADFKWSNDGRTALICYTDSFILVGSNSGQRHWHSMLNLDDYHITCASWAPNDEQLLLGVSNGNMVVIDLPRSELTELVVNQTNIRTMCWSSCEMSLCSLTKSFESMAPASRTNSSICSSSSSPHRRSSTTVVNHRRLNSDCSVFSPDRFFALGLQPGSSSSTGRSQNSRVRANHAPINKSRDLADECDGLTNTLAIDFANNTIKLYDGGLDDPDPRTILVDQESYTMNWSSDGCILAVAGFTIHTTAPSIGRLHCRYLNSIKFYTRQGKLVHQYTMNYTRYPITAFTWAHNDQRLFVATGPRLHCARVYFGIPALSLLASSCIQRHITLPDKSEILDAVLQHRVANIVHLARTWQSSNCPVRLDADEKLPAKSPKSRGSLLLSLGDGDDDENDGGIISNVCNNSQVYLFQIPLKLKSKIDQLFAPTIRQPFDANWSLNDIIWHVPQTDQRYYCTLVCYTSDRDIVSSGQQYKTNPIDQMSDIHNEHHHVTDQAKIFVLYVEFMGSLIPILRARRVGFLKPEFVIFDPEDNQIRSQRLRKVSDISQKSPQRQCRNNQLNYGLTSLINENTNFTDNCSDLHHQYPTSSEYNMEESSIGRQSLSDAEHYYNFESFSTMARPVAGDSRQLQQMRIADFVSNRSHHQEPLALPKMSNPYLAHMMTVMRDSCQVNQSKNPSLALSESKRHKLRAAVGKLKSRLTENSELVRLKSNIWGTKFKLINIGNRMLRRKSVLASVTYKASILHMSPRQIFLTIKDMSNYCSLCSIHHHKRINKPSDKVSSHQNNQSAEKYHHSLDTVTVRPTPLITPVSIAGKKGSKSRRDDDKVLLQVGDAVRIAPKLEANQRYRFISDNQKPSTSCQQPSSSNKIRRHKSKSGSHRARAGPSSASETHGSSWSCRPHPKHGTSFASLGDREDDDDVLTLSLGQGDQVRVEMSSIGNLDRDKEPVASTSATDQGAAMNEFLSTNKTLKSIQTITKMIVDLSSKANDPDYSASGDQPSPSKLIKLSPTADCPPERAASRFVAPDTPVHRPRRVASRLANNGVYLSQTQSATTTPLKSLNESSRHRRRSGRRNPSGSRTPDVCGALEMQLPQALPPPPPSVPIGRRLSLSAKRFFGGSLRSLQSTTIGYSSASDLEPEETEPLVDAGGRQSLQKDLRRRLLGQQASQPSSLIASGRNPLETGKHPSESPSLKQLLMQRICTAASSDGSSGETFSSSKRPAWRHGLHLKLSADRSIEIPVATRQDPSTPSSSCSDESSDDESVSSDFDSVPDKPKNKRFASLRDLKQIDDGFLIVGAGDVKQQPFSTRINKVMSGAGKRRTRRKSLCPSSSCCCAREFKLENRPPVWNKLNSVYQLDFGGRVTQESAKNLQIDYKGELALQFGRIDRLTYTLDYKYPFNAVQAMAIALASLTQRLK